MKRRGRIVEWENKKKKRHKGKSGVGGPTFITALRKRQR